MHLALWLWDYGVLKILFLSRNSLHCQTITRREILLLNFECEGEFAQLHVLYGMSLVPIPELNKTPKHNTNVIFFGNVILISYCSHCELSDTHLVFPLREVTSQKRKEKNNAHTLYRHECEPVTRMQSTTSRVVAWGVVPL